MLRCRLGRSVQSARSIPTVLIATGGFAAMILGHWSCSAMRSIEVVTRAHTVYLSKNAAALQVLIAYNSNADLQSKVEKLKANGEILALQPGVSVLFLDHKILTRNGLVPPFPMTGGEPNTFPVHKVRVIEGPQTGVEGWVLAVDVKLKFGPQV